MILKEVGKDKGLTKLFLEFPVALYATDANWIRPLDKDIEAIFDPKKNGHFAHGEAIRWVLFNKNNEVVGRVAAFYIQSSGAKDEMPVGGMGFSNASRILSRLNVYLMPAKNG